MNNLIESDKVIGTDVYGPDEAHIGEVRQLVLDKLGGRVSSAVVSFGGFLGIGEDYYPIPWAQLTYNERLGGFQINITKDQLKGAPRYGAAEAYDWSEERNRRVYDYYGTQPYW